MALAAPLMAVSAAALILNMVAPFFLVVAAGLLGFF
jgi:hypothetical protein